MELLHLISAREIIVQALAFLILFFVMKAFVWKPVLAFLDARGESVAAELRTIDETRHAVERLKAEYADRMERVEDEARQRIKEALLEGQKEAARIRQDAHRQAQRIIERAREEIRFELAEAKEELKERIVELTIDAAGHVIQEKLTEEEDKRLIRSFLERIGEKT